MSLFVQSNDVFPLVDLYRSFLMSSGKTRDYDPMSDDGYDSKIPLHNDEAFQHGIHFDAKVRSIGNPSI